ncbi:aaa-like domain protein, partial [Lasius niger]
MISLQNAGGIWAQLVGPQGVQNLTVGCNLGADGGDCETGSNTQIFIQDDPTLWLTITGPGNINTQYGTASTYQFKAVDINGNDVTDQCNWSSVKQPNSNAIQGYNSAFSFDSKGLLTIACATDFFDRFSNSVEIKASIKASVNQDGKIGHINTHLSINPTPTNGTIVGETSLSTIAGNVKRVQYHAFDENQKDITSA